MNTSKAISPSTFNSKNPYCQIDIHDFLYNVIQMVEDDSNVLDIGCGRGGLIDDLRKHKGCTVTGVDISQEAVDICRSKGLDCILSDAEELILDSSCYDVITITASLEHLLDPVAMLYKMNTWLAPGGSAIVAVPNFSHWMARLCYLKGVNVKRYEPGCIKTAKYMGVQSFGHIQFFNKTTLEYIMHKTGFINLAWNNWKPKYHDNCNGITHKGPLKLARKLLINSINRIPNHSLFDSMLIVRGTKTWER